MIGKQLAQGHDLVTRQQDAGVGIAGIDLRDQLPASATGRDHSSPSVHCGDGPDQALPSGYHAGDGGMLRAEAEAASGIDADADMDGVSRRDEGTATLPTSTVGESLRDPSTAWALAMRS